MTIETTEAETKLNEGIGFYIENSTEKSNGVREVPKKAFAERLRDVHGIDDETVRKVQSAVDYETTVAAHVALSDLEVKASKLSKEDLANDEIRRGLSSIVRLPTAGGNTEVEAYAERSSRIPGKTDESGNPMFSVTHGRIRTTINAERRIEKSFHDIARDRMRKALGVD